MFVNVCNALGMGQIYGRGLLECTVFAQILFINVKVLYLQKFLDNKNISLKLERLHSTVQYTVQYKMYVC